MTAPLRSINAPLIRLLDVSTSFGRGPVLEDVSLSFCARSTVGVIGANGSGKSTLLRILAGADQHHHGQVVAGSGASVGHLAQEPWLDSDGTVQSTIEEALFEIRELRARFSELCDRLETDAGDSDPLLAELGELGEALEQRDGWNIETRLEQAREALGCPDPDRPVSSLSGGERRRVALCRLLISRPDVLLLDEPTNHLDAAAVRWLGKHLAGYPGAVVAATHDRAFLDESADSIIELDRGRARVYLGGYSDYLSRKAQEAPPSGKQARRAHRRLLAELTWAKADATARSQAARDRIRDYERRAVTQGHGRSAAAELVLPPGPRLGTQVVDAEHVVKTVSDRTLIDDLSFSLPPGGIVALLGPNGAGKTTLLRMIAGLESWDRGSLRLGESVRISYLDQARAALGPPAVTPRDLLMNSVHSTLASDDEAIGAFLALFGIRGDEQRTPVGRASGGQRGRLNLALALARGGNLLLLDEPTNDLDLTTVRALEDALVVFPGCAVIASHDSWFLDRLATHVLAWEGHRRPGAWAWYEGPPSSYCVDGGVPPVDSGPHRRLPATDDTPRRARRP
jgi:ATPase subunit of ABC transporter with duplicated ATPase domains